MITQQENNKTASTSKTSHRQNKYSNVAFEKISQFKRSDRAAAERLTSSHGRLSSWWHRHRCCCYDELHSCGEKIKLRISSLETHITKWKSHWAAEQTDLCRWRGSRGSFQACFPRLGGTTEGSDRRWTGCLYQPESETSCWVEV